MQNKLIIISMMKYSLQNRVFPQKIDRLIHNHQNALVLIFKTAWDTTTEILLYIILFCITLVIHSLLIQPDCVRGNSKCSSNLTRQATGASDRSPNKCSNTDECWSIVLNRTLEIYPGLLINVNTQGNIFDNFSPTTAIFICLSTEHFRGILGRYFLGKNLLF